LASRTDHDRRDAQHAARATIAIELARYVRRVTEAAYAHIEEEAASYDGSAAVDFTATGIAAAHRALTEYGIFIGPARAIEATPRVEAGSAQLT
jgi:hypothetical protein